MTRGDVRRAKLYYLRDRIGKAAKIKEKRELTPLASCTGRRPRVVAGVLGSVLSLVAGSVGPPDQWLSTSPSGARCGR